MAQVIAGLVPKHRTNDVILFDVASRDYVVGFNTLAGDLNDDGVVDLRDQALITAAFNRNASQVDRRMDYDGDGKITLNDYRLWAVLYRAYLQ